MAWQNDDGLSDVDILYSHNDCRVLHSYYTVQLKCVEDSWFCDEQEVQD